MTPERERWAEAAMVDRRHGADAPLHVAVRLGELALAGDHAGVCRWREIAFRLDRLRRMRDQADGQARGSGIT